LEKFPYKELPYETYSICPECILEGEVNVLKANVYEENGKVMIDKTCPIHGYFKDVYWGDADLFRRAMQWWYKGIGLENPRTKTVKGCPLDCGLCPNHKSHTALALIDVTNRCNMRCPICFANAAATGYVYEPSIEEIAFILKNFRDNRPVPAPAIQFAGGEPTVREDLPELVKLAKEIGFPHVEIATNGLRLAHDLDYAKKLKEAGLSTIYLQFDGVTPEPYYKSRGRNVLPEKLQAIENCREVGLHSIVLVPTVVRGMNDDQLGKIIEFAVKNYDVIRGVNFQPVSITGRIDRKEREKMRITIPDLMKLIERQTNGRIKVDDWFPTTYPIPLARTLGLMKKSPVVEFSAHPACGMSTFIVVEEDGSYAPITEYVNAEKVAKIFEKAAGILSRGGFLSGFRAKLSLLGVLWCFKDSSLRRQFLKLVIKKDYNTLGDFMRRVIMVSSMHFQDPYNFDLERVQQCIIHYGIPDGRIIPFCSMNSIHRERIEKQFSIPINEWKRRKGKLTPVEEQSIEV